MLDAHKQATTLLSAFIPSHLSFVCFDFIWLLALGGLSPALGAGSECHNALAAAVVRLHWSWSGQEEPPHLLSCTGRVSSSHAVLGPFASARGTTNYVSCVWHSNSCAVSSGSGEKKTQNKQTRRLSRSALQAELRCAAWCDTDSLKEPWSHRALCDLI